MAATVHQHLRISREFDIRQLPNKALKNLSKFFTKSELANLLRISRVWNQIIEPYLHLNLHLKFDVCQLPNKALKNLSKFFIKSELANLLRISRVWNLIIEPHIHHIMPGTNLTYSISSRCKIPAPICSLGAIYSKPLKLAQILNPRCCFSVRVENGTISREFKMLKFKDIPKYQSIERSLSTLTRLFKNIPPILHSAIMGYLDEFSLVSNAAYVSKSWLFNIQNYSIKWRDDFHHFQKGKVMKEQQRVVLLYKFSSRTRECKIQIAIIPSSDIDSSQYYSSYTIRPLPNIRLLDYLKTQLPILIRTFNAEYEEHCRILNNGGGSA